MAHKRQRRDPTVVMAQQRMNALGIRGADGQPLRVDGVRGPNTQFALEQYGRMKEGGGAGGPPQAPMRGERYQNPNPFVMPTPRANPMRSAPPGLGALMGMPATATAGAPSFQRPQAPQAPPMPGYDEATTGPPGRPPSRFGGMPMRDPQSRLTDMLASEATTPQQARDVADAYRVKMAMPFNGQPPVGLPIPPPLREFAPPMPPPTGMGGMAGNGGMGPMPPMDLAGAGVIGNEGDKFPMNRGRFGDGFLPDMPPSMNGARFSDAMPPPMAPAPPPEMGWLDKLRRALGVAVPEQQPAAAEQGDLSNPQPGARVMLKGKPYEFDGMQWRPAQ